MIFLDTETCGLHGMAVLLQTSRETGPVDLYDLWLNPIGETLQRIEAICEEDICGFNLAYDWFHLSKVYSTFRMAPDYDWYPADHINEMATLEEKARFTDICIKPRSAFDLMLHARKGPFQSLMARDDIKIRRIPTPLAWKLAKELENRIKFDDIYFARRKDKSAPRWQVYDIKDNDGNINPDFKDIKLKFHASGALKNLAIHVLKVDPATVLRFSDIEVDRAYWPHEVGYAPFAKALSNESKNWRTEKGFAWPGVIKEHINHWAYNSRARRYAGDDVVRYTRPLWEYFGRPKPGDDDSELACCVAAVRWRGFSINADRIRSLKVDAESKIAAIPTDSRRVRTWIYEVMDETERMGDVRESTKKTVLEEIAKWKTDEGDVHPAAQRAQTVLDARIARKEIELYNKLLIAGRFHASFKVIGTLSNRMAGTDGLNPQAIKNEENVRRAFLIAEQEGSTFEIEMDGKIIKITCPASSFCGGDFESFEVCIAEAVFACPSLRKALLSGKKIHAMFGMELFPGKTYEEICASKSKKDGSKIDMYDKGKKGVFLIFYGGDDHTIVVKLGIAPEIASPAFESFYAKHPEIETFQLGVQKDFGCLEQKGGIGTKVEWVEPKDFAESFLGFKRFFTLENKIAKTLYELAQSVPKEWRSVKIKVMRRDRIQTAAGAVSSALYGAAFGIASRNVRAAKNHYIQSPGAQITKATQRKIWDLQPSGVSKFIVRPANVHDEFLCPTAKSYEPKVEAVVRASVESYRPKIPLIEIDWKNNMLNWSEK